MIETKVIDIDLKNIDMDKLRLASKVLREGGTVAFPTETVYGLGANALDSEALKKIFIAKGRPSDNPLIVHISKKESINILAREIPQKTHALMDKFWPGPLTMVFKRSNIVPSIITAGLDTVAIRMPSHPVAKALIAQAGVPVAAPSANLSGKPSPTQASHVMEDLYGKVDIIIRGGSCAVGLESTVLDITEEVPVILRPGGVTLEDLQEVLGDVSIDKGLADDNGVPKAPGMKYTHYSPKAEVILVTGNVKDIVDTISRLKKQYEKKKKVGIMATDETKDNYYDAKVISMGSRSNPEIIAENIFSILRKFDEEGVDIILAEGIEVKYIGHAVMNRMLKASGHNVVKAGR